MDPDPYKKTCSCFSSALEGNIFDGPAGSGSDDPEAPGKRRRAYRVVQGLDYQYVGQAGKRKRVPQ